jgi:hypothetical protein
MKVVLFTLFMLCSSTSFAQDERFFRRLYTGDFAKKKKQAAEKIYFEAKTPSYRIDLNDDFNPEYIHFEKKNGQNLLVILDNQKKKIYEYKLPQLGIGASLFRILIENLSNNVKVFVLSFYEGDREYLSYGGSARYYFLTMEKNNLKSLSMYQGPYFWREHKDRKSDYTQRNLFLGFKDYNKDGIKEVSVKHHFTNRVYFYRGDGKWSAI